MGEDREVLLEMKNISKSFYGTQVLKNVDFSIMPGEIHALIGENGAGKSTLMKIAMGFYQADGGTTYFKGNVANFRSSSESLHAGLSMIHQEISLVPTLDIAENIWLGREKQFEKAGLIRVKERYKATRELLQQLKIDLDPAALVSELTVAQMQLVEIVRAVSYHADLIVMDEPTSALSSKEIDNLYQIIRFLSANGTAIIFISHKLEELFAICQRFTIMRDGQVVAVRSVDEITMNELIAMISGRPIQSGSKQPKQISSEVVLECRDLCAANGTNHVSFQLHRGEILGFSGLMGSGRTEIMKTIYGLDPLTSGEIYLNGTRISIRSPKDAVHHGIAMITEDRLRTGAIHILSVKFNATITNLFRLCNKLGFIHEKQEKAEAHRYIQKMNVKIASLNQPISDLSGGNQQKVIIGRALMINPMVIIMDEPTRGIDVGAKDEVHNLIDALADEGMSVIIVSSELPEVMRLSDRIMVVRDGSIVAEYLRQDATQNKLMADAFGVSDASGEE